MMILSRKNVLSTELDENMDLSFQSTLTMENNGLTHPLTRPMIMSQGTTTSIASIKPEKVFSVPLIIQISINYQIL
jgi:hypothetical protein